MIRRLFILPLILLLAACSSAAPNPTAPPATAPPPPAAPTSTTAPTATAEPTAAPTTTPEPTEIPAPTFAPALEPYEDLVRAEPNSEQLAAGEALASIVYPEGDYELDLISHGKLDGPITGFEETDNERLVAMEAVDPIPLNTRRDFWISDVDTDKLSEVEFKLLGVSEHAYFWFDTDREPDPEQVQDAMDGFEAIVADIQAIFGAENPLGIDGDPRIFILHPAATKVCNVSEATAHQCGLGGYFWSVNEYPTEIFWFSNVHEGLIMNYDAFVIGGSSYLDTLTHEYRHLVEYWYRDDTETWEAEGQAVMAEDLLGYRRSNISFANTFMGDPDIQLDTWTSSSGARTIAHYGQGYVFSRYVYDRFGPDFFSAWAVYPAGGLEGLGALLSEQGHDLSGEQLWLDFLTTLVLFDKDGAPDGFSLDPEFSAALDPVGVTNIPSPPRTIEDEVRQYGADIYRFVPGQDVHVTFTGSTLASLTGRMPPSGQSFWYSGRALSGLRTLTLEADLSGVDSATLQYATYFKFSKAFGFGYVVISTDGGQTWTQLVTESMKGDKAQDDPYGFALTESFYTGNATGGSWIDESIDLSEYAGQQVLIRWEADSGDRDLGFAIDNIAIPEIGFYDDVESEVAGWSTDSWVRATAYIPQTYHLILITFVDGAPVVTTIPLESDNSAEFDVSGLADADAYLIIAATSPQSLQPTAYMIETTAR